MAKNERTKSVFLYGKPTKIKLESLFDTQKEYTNLINTFIEKLKGDKQYFLSVFNNNKKAPQIRKLEKDTRPSHNLGSAYGQNAIDQSMKELHNHFTRIKNSLFGALQNKSKELIPYVSFISLLNASLLDEDEFLIVEDLLKLELSKTKRDEEKIESYEQVCNYLCSLTSSERSENRSYIRALFYEKLEFSKLPFVKKAVIQLDTRVSRLEASHSTKKDFVVFIKLLHHKKWQEIPVGTSRNGLRRMSQYKRGSMTVGISGNKIKVGVPITKKVQKQNQKELLGVDCGITDLFYTSSKQSYGTFTGMVNKYENTLERKLGNRSSLRNKCREYQKQLKKSKNKSEQKFLKAKIKNISDSLNNKKALQKKRRQYSHIVDVQISEATIKLFKEIKTSKYLPVFENLEITKFDRGRKANKRNSSWVHGKLIKKITEKLDWHGYDYRTVDPAYTSKTCQRCHNVHDDNRKGKRFICTVCKYSADADYNASVNIKMRAFDKELTQIVECNKFNTKKRHISLKFLLESRHRSHMSKVS